MSKKSTIAGFQTRPVRRGSSALVGRDARTGRFGTAASRTDVSSASGGNVVKPKAVIKPVPLDPDAFMDYLLEEDAVIMEHLAK